MTNYQGIYAQRQKPEQQLKKPVQQENLSEIEMLKLSLTARQLKKLEKLQKKMEDPSKRSQEAKKPGACGAPSRPEFDQCDEVPQQPGSFTAVQLERAEPPRTVQQQRVYESGSKNLIRDGRSSLSLSACGESGEEAEPQGAPPVEVAPRRPRSRRKSRNSSVQTDLQADAQLSVQVNAQQCGTAEFGTQPWHSPPRSANNTLLQSNGLCRSAYEQRLAEFQQSLQQAELLAETIRPAKAIKMDSASLEQALATQSFDSRRPLSQIAEDIHRELEGDLPAEMFSSSRSSQLTPQRRQLFTVPAVQGGTLDQMEIQRILGSAKTLVQSRFSNDVSVRDAEKQLSAQRQASSGGGSGIIDAASLSPYEIDLIMRLRASQKQ